MAGFEGIKAIVNQAVTAVMMVLRDVDAGPQPAVMGSLRKPQRCSRPALEKLLFNWNAQDR